MKDRATSHTALEVIRFLFNKFYGRRSKIIWLPYSPGQNVLDYFFWLYARMYVQWEPLLDKKNKRWRHQAHNSRGDGSRDGQIYTSLWQSLWGISEVVLKPVFYGFSSIRFIFFSTHLSFQVILSYFVIFENKHSVLIKCMVLNDTFSIYSRARL